ncbi:MAG TPA: PKD domain-containing protein [Flavobacterium sp.]|jgi:hypothetical protein
MSSILFAQQEASNWYFGNNAGLRFNLDGSATALGDGELDTDEGCSAISDADGNLLFYTDGRTVWDRYHVPMPEGNYLNGTGLHGDYSSTQSAIIVPKPGDPNIYYVFTVDEPHHENAAVYPSTFSGSYLTAGDGSTPVDDDGRNRGLNYSIVDLTVSGSNGSMGDILARNNHLITYDPSPSGQEIKYKCSEKITAVKSEGLEEYWIITHFLNRFFSFKVDASGVNDTPIISTIGPTVGLDGYRRNAQGYLKMSPDGHRLAIAHAQNGTVEGEATFSSGQVILYDFNVSSGVVSNEQTVVSGVQPYGVEFSPQSQKLYTTYREGTNGNMNLAQFDLTSSNIPNSKIVIFDDFNYLYALQLAPNNKIYCATGYQNFLGVVNSPDEQGLLCNYENEGQFLYPGSLASLGLPPFITSFFNFSFTVENLCLGSNTNFLLNSSQPALSVLWDFGDGNTSTEENPAHQYLLPGQYLVSSTITTSAGTTTKTKSITISLSPISVSIPAQTVCHMVGKAFNVFQFDEIVLGSQSPSTFDVSYFLSQTDAEDDVNPLSDNFEPPLGISSLFVKISNQSSPSCNILTDFQISVSTLPTVDAVGDFVICENLPYDDIEEFDLSIKISEILGNQAASDFQVSYHLSEADAVSSNNALPFLFHNISTPQTIFFRIQNSDEMTCHTTGSFN